MYLTSIDTVYSLVGGSDYQEISAAAHEVLLTFDNANRQQSFNMTILDDSLFELDAENFTLELRFSPFEIPPSNAVLQPNVSTVEILDEDCKIETIIRITIIYI